ncbi:phosphotyrosine protein phosphatase [Rubrivivax gelatinosus]|nr:phosphotyrosine protein phosphatase [Rubrivivax gelatinosus]
MSAPPSSVLMVCMGNICRSPTAEGVLRAKLEAAGLAREVRVDSAGTHGYHVGEAPDPRAVRFAAARGYDLARLRARKVAREDFSRYDWILAMDEDNLTRLRQIAPDDAGADLGLLMDHALRHSGVREVPDPYYGAAAGFERVLDLVEDACEGIVARLLRARSS